MPEGRSDWLSTRIDELGRRYRLWFLVPLFIAAALALWSRSAALGFMVVMICIWAFIGVIGLILLATEGLLPTSVSAEDKAEIRQSVGLTVFLGSLALAGMVLRGENAVSKFVARTKPDGFNVAFVDPTFAFICIVLVWLYTAYRIRK